MDKRLLDPRRSRRAPTAEDRAEQLAPYAEELPVAPGGYATFNKQVAGLRGAPRRPRPHAAALELRHGISGSGFPVDGGPRLQFSPFTSI
jgi:hypothetical protein